MLAAQASGALAPHADPREGERVAALARVLSDPIRVQIVGVLRAHRGELCQCELAPLFDVAQPTLSHHMKKLREAGIVTVSRRGRWAFYALDPRGLEVLEEWLCRR